MVWQRLLSQKLNNMKDRVFKAVWVTPANKLWSVMYGCKGFYRPATNLTDLWKTHSPIRYKVNQVVVPKVNAFQALFAFASVLSAVSFSVIEYTGNVRGNRIVVSDEYPNFLRKGHIEIWEGEGDVMDQPKSPIPPEPSDPMYAEKYIYLNAPHGTLFCKSIKLLSRVDYLGIYY